MLSSPSSISSRETLQSRALAAEQQGRIVEALASWKELLKLDPDHPRALLATGFEAHQRGDLARARELFEHAAKFSKDDPTPWINVARICRLQKNEHDEEKALFQALTVDPGDLMALLLRGQLLERQGRMHEAAKAYGAATLVAPPTDRLRPDLRPLVAHAAEVRNRHGNKLAEHLDSALSKTYERFSGEDLARFRLSIDIMLGRKTRFEAKPAQYFLPGVPAVEFFDRSLFPWLDAIEAGTDEIREEFLKVLEADEGFAPYILYGSDEPVNQWAELNHSPRWSAYHLIKDGLAVEPAAAKCPGTMQLLSAAPQPVQAGRTPVALFSLLKPGTRIPAHNGVSNARVLVHLPLIVPEGCGFRVGNSVRSWVPGQSLIFDDTIEHEAWNNSDKLRVVLIFDAWHPSLSVAEQALLTALSTAVNAFSGQPVEGYGA